MGSHIDSLKLYMRDKHSARLPDGSLPTAVYTTDDLIANINGIRIVVTQRILLTEKVELPIDPSIYGVCIGDDLKPVFVRTWEDRERSDAINVEHLFIGINPRVPLQAMLSPVVMHVSDFVSKIEQYIERLGQRPRMQMPRDPFLDYTAAMMFGDNQL